MKRLIALLATLAFSVVQAQTPPPRPTGPQVSPNLIQMPGTNNNYPPGVTPPGSWTGVEITTSTGGGAGPSAGGRTPGYNVETGTIMFGYTLSTVAYTYAFSQALQNSGMSILGYNYSWDYKNQGQTRGALTASVAFTGINGQGLHAKSWTLGQTTGNDWLTYSGTETFTSSLLAANIANFSLSFRGKDDRGWAGYYGPVVRNPTMSLNYIFDPCSADPLSSPSCPGYAAAYKTQQCNANALYDTTCPGYAVAYLTQQCTADPLYSTTCPGYQQAYYNQQCTLQPLYDSNCPGYQQARFNQQCSADPLYNTACPGYQQALLTQQCNANQLYSTSCPGYQTAYHNQQCTANPLYATDCPGYAVAYKSQQCTANPLYAVDCPGYSTAYAKKNILNIGSTITIPTTTSVAATTTSSDPVAQAAPVVSDPTVNSVVTTKSTATNADATPAAPVKLTQPAQTTSTQENIATKKSDSTTTQTVSAENKPADKPQTTREALAETQREKARDAAVAKGKDLAKTMGRAADMQAQMEVQNVVIQAMGYTPGFDAYGRVILPDTQFYRPYEAYPGQRNIDTVSGRRLFGGSDLAHQQMVDSQYNLGN